MTLDKLSICPMGTHVLVPPVKDIAGNFYIVHSIVGYPRSPLSNETSNRFTLKISFYPLLFNNNRLIAFHMTSYIPITPGNNCWMLKFEECSINPWQGEDKFSIHQAGILCSGLLVQVLIHLC